jgi:uridine monophosphate synthetase
MGFFDLLKNRIDAIDSILCVGLDPHVKQLPQPSAAAAEQHSLELIQATAEYAACYKPNAAFFEVFGDEGAAALKRVVKAAKATGAPVLLDAKRGDIGTTSDAYAASAFDELGADAITLSPYMGWDSLAPFVDPALGYGDRCGAFVLCKTSNPSSADIQTLRVAEGGNRVFEKIASLAVPGQGWNKYRNVGLVVGATDSMAMESVRKTNPTGWILAPGIGAQGGDLEAVCQLAITGDGYGLLLPISRGISAAKDPRKAAKDYMDAINVVRHGKMQPPPTKAAVAADLSFLEPYQKDFIDEALLSNVLRFGSFTLKSGRSSPYFFNAGLFNTGRAQSKLCSAYAARIAASGISFDVIFGPAYKGIALASGIGAALFSEHGIDVGFAYNRKEVKDHGEGGNLVGADISGKRCLLVDDVISAGTAIRDAKAILDAAGAKLVGVTIALDRQERTGADGELSQLSAVQSVQAEFGVDVLSIVGLDGLLAYLEVNDGRDSSKLEEHASDVRAYRQRYGVS